MKADVVVVGAGLAGCALAYHLSFEGLGVVLVDRDYPGLGASGRSAGLLTVQHWNPLDVLLVQASRQIYEDLLGQDGAVQKAAFLRATTQEEDIDLMEERVKAYRREGLEAELLHGEELATRFPSIHSSDLRAGILTSRDGYVDAYDATTAFASGARERGATLRMGTAVRRIQVRSSRVIGVETAAGDLSAEAVVIAAGAWTPSLLQGLGLELPLKPYRTQALVTAPLEDQVDLPMFHELPRGFYFRPDQDGLLMGDGTEHREADPRRHNTHADFEMYSMMASWIARRVPSLGEARIARGWAGLCVATPDRLPLVGEVEELKGLLVLSGFNGLGVMRIPPLAESLAEVLLGRKPSFELAPFHPGRFDAVGDFPIREGFSLE
jgi:glycine/D-amino acid oxidase-like deaminating enzyme